MSRVVFPWFGGETGETGAVAGRSRVLRHEGFNLRRRAGDGAVIRPITRLVGGLGDARGVLLVAEGP